MPSVLEHSGDPFGPMAAIRSFNTLEEAITEANRLPYGLAGYAFTRSLKNADLLARRVKVWIGIRTSSI